MPVLDWAAHHPPYKLSYAMILGGHYPAFQDGSQLKEMSRPVQTHKDQNKVLKIG